MKNERVILSRCILEHNEEIDCTVLSVAEQMALIAEAISQGS
jgi:hypothetical protein